MAILIHAMIIHIELNIIIISLIFIGIIETVKTIFTMHFHSGLSRNILQQWSALIGQYPFISLEYTF